MKKRVYSALAAAGMLASSVLLISSTVMGATLTSARLALGDSRPSQVTSYTVTASGFSTGSTIGCIEVDLGSAADGSGAITGLSTASSSLTSQTVTATGTWTVDNTQNAAHKLRATNGTPVAPQSGSQSIAFANVTNGSTAGTSYYAVVTTYQTNACATPVDTVTVQFIYVNGQAVTVNVDGSLTFAVNSVASGQAVNGPNTTATSTSTTMPFGTLTAATNNVVAQDLAVATNAGAGYTVFTRYTGQLSNGTYNFTNHSGTNASPTAFSAAGTEAFGYTTNDATLGTGTADRFTNPSNRWAAFSTTNSEVAYSSAPVASETTRVGLQVGRSSTTPAGTYATTVIYTATPVY